MKIVSTGILGGLLSIMTLLLSAIIIPAGAEPISPKLRVEQEFRRLEAAIARCIYDDVLAAHDVEEMNRALYDFMQDNPGVVRILRTNAGGITVNDVRSDSPVSAPPREIRGQRWFQNVAQNRRAHYSMDVDSATNEITLFYAWPLMTGADASRFSGAFAAMIDFTAQAALIDDAAPFQIAFDGRAFFEHSWNDANYSEEPLNVRGTNGLTIRTMKGAATILDPRPQRERKAGAGRAGVEVDEMDDDEYIASLLGNTKPRPKRERPGLGNIAIDVNTGIFVLLLIIAAMLGYLIISRKRGPKRFVKDTERMIVTSMPEKTAAAPPPTPAPTTPPHPPKPGPAPKPDETGLDLPVVNVEKIADGDLYKVGKEADITREQKDAIGTMLKLIKDELMVMDRKIKLLAHKVGELEKRK